VLSSVKISETKAFVSNLFFSTAEGGRLRMPPFWISRKGQRRELRDVSETRQSPVQKHRRHKEDSSRRNSFWPRIQYTMQPRRHGEFDTREVARIQMPPKTKSFSATK
jgi:hypothetical protein